jgi:hypothetical protein
MQHPSAVFIHPSGADHNIKEYLNIWRKVYGDKQGKQFRAWVDNVLATQISSDTWLVKFDKWELHGMSLLCVLLFISSFHFPLLYISQIKQFDILIRIPLLCWQPMVLKIGSEIQLVRPLDHGSMDSTMIELNNK